jgi:hypothetical protein
MVDKAFEKVDDAVQKQFDKVKEGVADDAPVDLPGTFKKRDSDTDEVVGEAPADTGRHDDVPTPGARESR